LLGVTQEQHPERCRLFAQWKGLGWPILHDPINVLGSVAVPLVVAIDEHGIVRSTRPRPATLEAEFLTQTFADDASGVNPSPYGPAHPPAFDQLRRRAESAGRADEWRSLGDALALWGGSGRLNEAITAYTRATEIDPQDGRAYFRLGVCLRRRYESTARERDDFQAAVENWSRAVEVDPNRYIWRRRIQQYGPRLDKPYPFYDWVPEAERAIRARGDQPVRLPVPPQGAEIARPVTVFGPAKPAVPPDPDGRVKRVEPKAVAAEVTVVPARVKPGKTARVHVVLRLDPNSKLHWNHEAEPLRVWLDPPDGWLVGERLLTAEVPAKVVTEGDRILEFEVQVPAGATRRNIIPGYALFHVCDAVGGQCRYVRLDVAVEINVAK
jgi:hypothetical protein